LTLYYLNEADRRRLVLAQERLARLFLAAGAEVVYPGIHGWRPIRSLRDLEANLKKSPRVWDIDISAYHAHGTCHMGADPKRAVTNAFGELHEVKNLFVCDGSVVPPTLGVNPQVTISALALRTGEHIAERLKAAY
jgi:choline dehydrogenase-like flavoprotein